MNCEWTRQNIALYVYDELRDDERYDFERHISSCAGCRQELEEVQGLKTAMSATPVIEPSANLVARSRMRLQEALENERQGLGFRRFTFDLAGWITAMKFSPALTAALLIFGFFGGSLATWQLRPHVAVPGGVPPGPSQTAEAAVASIRGIVQEPGTNKVKVSYDTLRPESTEGSLDDPKIQQLLLYAARNNMNSGVRMDSIDLLTQNPSDQNVREALIFALRYDRNPGVRLKAIEGLRTWVKSDLRVRDVVIEALMKDSNPGVRAQAVAALQEVKGDGAVQGAFAALANDKDKYIQGQARRALATAPQME
jgi:hypothetical protein